MTNGSAGPGNLLEGWKAIADYLGVSPKTAQNYRKSKSLPVLYYLDRHPVAYTAELDHWKHGRLALGESELPLALDKSPHIQKRKWAAVALSAVVLVTVAFLLRGRDRVREMAPEVPDRPFARALSEGSATVKLELPGSPGSVALTPDGKTLYTLGMNSAEPIQVIDAATLKRQPDLPVPDPIAIEFSPDARRMYVGTTRGGLYVVDLPSHRIAAIVNQGIEREIRDLAVTPDGAHVYLALYNQGLGRFDVASGRISIISRVPCPWRVRVDSSGQRLFVVYQCGGPGGDPLHNTIDVMDLPSEKTIQTLRSPGPMIGGDALLFPDGDRIWAEGGDACLNPEYLRQLSAGACPFAPGSITHIFRLSDGKVLRTLGAPRDRYLSIPVFLSGGTRAIVGEAPLRVVDTTFFTEVENLTVEPVQTSLPAIDINRRRFYVVKSQPPRLESIDFPMSNCDPPLLGLLHLWAGDNTLADRRAEAPLRASTGSAGFAPGIVGAAFRLTSTELIAEDLYHTLRPLSDTNGTFAVWLKRLANQSGPVARLSIDDTAVWSLNLASDGSIRYEQTGSEPAQGKTRLESGEWSHVALIREGTRIRLYINGQREFELERPRVGVKSKVAPTRLRLGPVAALADEAALMDHSYPEAQLARLIHQGRTCVWGGKRPESK